MEKNRQVWKYFCLVDSYFISISQYSYIRVVHLSFTSKYFDGHLICGARDLPDPSLSFTSAIALSSTSRVRFPIFAITAQYGALCLYCWQCCPLLTAHHRHHTDTRASQYRLVAWQVGLGPPSPSCPPHPHPATGPGSPGWRPMCPLM